jgi:ABC-2 type transport system permease protein
VFVRLKLRIMTHRLRGRARRIVGFVLSAIAGLWLAGSGFLLFLGSGAADRDAGYVLVAFAGGGVVLGWVLLPLLFFGVDETLDPARFALLPLPRRTLALGMLAGALVGIPGAATALAFVGVCLAGWWRAGPAGAVVGTLGAALALLLCVVASRALTSAVAGLLRSRRVRDLAAVLLALLAASIGPINLTLASTFQHPSLGPALRVARVVGWTPLSAGFIAPYDVADGHPLLAVARLALVAGTVALLLLWWATTLESAMVGTTAGGAVARAVRGGAVAALTPRVLGSLRAGPFSAIMAQELRYWSRDARRRASLISITIGGAVVPVALRLLPAEHGKHGVSLPLAVVFSSVTGAAMLANQFGFDGSAYSAHLLAAVPGRVDLRARAAALSLIMLPLVVVIVVAVALLSGDAADLAQALGVVAAMYGTSMGVASVLSVVAAFPVADSSNIFASSGGSGTAKGLFTLIGMAVSAAVASPVLLAALLLPAALAWTALPLGVVFGIGAVLVATYLVGDHLDRSGPELLAEVGARP